MQFATRIIKLENENRFLKLMAEDRQALRGRSTEVGLLAAINHRFGTSFTALRRYLCFQNKILFSMPGADHRSSFEMPRDPRQIQFPHDKGMAKAMQGNINIFEDNLYIPEKNVDDVVTHIYNLKDKNLLTLDPAQKKNLIAQVYFRKLSLEEYMMPIYAKKWFDGTESSVDAFQDELHYFFVKLEALFYVSQIELSFTFSPKIRNFKLDHPGWTQKLQTLEKEGQKLNQITIIKKNLLYDHADDFLETLNVFNLTTRMGGHYWGTLTLNIPYDLTKSSYRMPEIKEMLHDVIVRFSRRASGNLTFIDKEDHLIRVKSKSKENEVAARISQKTQLNNTTAFDELLMSIFMSGKRLIRSEYLSFTHLDGKALGLQNEALGHEVADRIIKEYAKAIVQYFKSSYHLSGDEFAIVERTKNTKEHQDRLSEMFLYLRENPLSLELSYYDLTKMLVNTLINAHKAARNDETMLNYSAEQLWNKVGFVLDENDPYIKTIKNQLKAIFKKFSINALSPENVLSAKEHLVTFVTNLVRRDQDITEEQIIDAHVRPEHYRMLEENKKSRAMLIQFADSAQQSFLKDVFHKKIEVHINMSLTAGTYFIGRKKYIEMKWEFRKEDHSEQDLLKLYENLRMKTIQKADDIRGKARALLKDSDFFIDP
jgi:GGDEF domain-containing protein